MNFPAWAQSAVLLVVSNVFMTFAWYAHLKNMAAKPWVIAALVSWGIALFEYLVQVPANRIGYTVMSLGQLKILQEVITLAVFVPFAVLYMKQPLKLDFLWAGLCLVGAARCAMSNYENCNPAPSAAHSASTSSSGVSQEHTKRASPEPVGPQG
jgi:uncharacterized protein